MSFKSDKKPVRLHQLYLDKRGEIQKDLSLKNVNEVPKIAKVVVNIGQGDAVQNVKNLEAAVKELALITGQKPLMTRAKKSIATFKLREGMPIGCCVTLRGARMYEFLDRLINISIPRIRDFRGFSAKAFDGRGNYSLGIKEQIIFPEIDYDKIDKVRGLGITITTTSKDDVGARKLLDVFNFPFRK